MRALWRRLASRLDALTLRERVLALLAALAVLGSGWLFLVLDPWLAERTALARQMATTEQQLAAVKARTEAVLARAEQDPNQVLRVHELRLRTELEQLDRELQARAGDFVAPAEMARALRDLLAVQGGLRLVRLETLPPAPLQADDQAGAVPVYQHGLELEFVGDYLSTLRFLQAAEALPWRFFWDALDYRVEQHPTARVRVRIHTLSSREAWIGV